ncbi:hypothetical protein ACS6IR_17970, partial [Enterobacter hormaechei subsp. hoffmannii]|uniref:hypothetical protein n=1 Tax=Enterobacter hormaechei TaxID=158836 RepID=UPI003F42A865
RINKKLILKVKRKFCNRRAMDLVNSRYHYRRVAHKMSVDVKKGKKKTECGASGSIRDKQTFRTE